MIVVLGIGGTHLSGFQMSVINYTSPVGKAGEKKIPSLTAPQGPRPYILEMLYKALWCCYVSLFPAVSNAILSLSKFA